METKSISQEQPRCVVVEESSGTVGKVFCKCDDGWTCLITRTDGTDSGEAFFKCDQTCTCVIDESGAAKPIMQQDLEKISGGGGGGAYCKCGEGWKCVISKTGRPDSGKGFECAGSCTCSVEA